MHAIKLCTCSTMSCTDPPTDVALQSTPASVNNGSSTTINCTGHSRPPPEFSITRRLANGKKSTSSGGTFLLQPTSREELGDNLLTCSATNSKYSTRVFSATRTILVKGGLKVENMAYAWRGTYICQSCSV